MRITGEMRSVSIAYFTAIVRPTISTIIPKKLMSFKPMKFSKPGIICSLEVSRNLGFSLSAGQLFCRADNTNLNKLNYLPAC